VHDSTWPIIGKIDGGPGTLSERQQFTRNETRVHRVAGPLCAERGRSIRIAEALDRIGAHRFTAASYLHGTRRLPFEDRTNGVVGALADKDFGIEVLGRGLQTRRQVHRITDGRGNCAISLRKSSSHSRVSARAR
jgi:hypothetical protein